MQIVDDLDQLLGILPPDIQSCLVQHPERDRLVEIVLDLGRCPEARFPERSEELRQIPVTRAELDYCVQRVGMFSGDNRAGIERTLHRISALRNRTGDIIGLTCRVGRAIFGTIALIRDLVETGQSILMLGRPGVGKTTALREIARVLADELNKRVVIIDTSNEIAGDGDIPHPAIGRARRMQVARPELQHQVMIEAVENHMPEVIVIDEIGTELEAQAARTIAERGVQLVGTAHGNYLENLIKNPTLSDLVGGIQSVTLGDDEARRRGSQKTVLERKAPPTFDIAVEMIERQKWVVHESVGQTVDSLLRGRKPMPQTRTLSETGQVLVSHESSEPVADLTQRQSGREGGRYRPGGSLGQSGPSLSTPAVGSWRSAPLPALTPPQRPWSEIGWRSTGQMSPLPPTASQPSGARATGSSWSGSSWSESQRAGSQRAGTRHQGSQRATTPSEEKSFAELLEESLPSPTFSPTPSPGGTSMISEARTAYPGGSDAYPSQYREPHGNAYLGDAYLGDAYLGDYADEDELSAARMGYKGDDLPLHVYPYAVSRHQLEQIINSLQLPIVLTKDITDADAVLALRTHLKNQSKLRHMARTHHVPIHAIKSNTTPQMVRALRRLLNMGDVTMPEEVDLTLFAANGSDDELEALEEARLAVEQIVLQKGQPVELLPRSAKVRKMQHELVEHYRLKSTSFGDEPNRRIRIYPA